MTDPVDTDALRIVAQVTDQERSTRWASAAFRAAADEVDRLRDRLHHVERWTVPEAIRTWQKEHAEVDRLRAVIERAPHGRACRWLYATSQPCTCWKAEAL